MPEGAEVRRIVDQMGELVNGKPLYDIEIVSGRYIKKAPDGFSDFIKSLPLTITKVGCKGKFIYFETDGEWNIWNTLGLTGGWSKDLSEVAGFHRLTFSYAYGPGDVFFHDMRNFGTLKFVNSKAELQKKLATLGQDPLIEDISDQIFKTKIKNRGHKTLPEILMDQSCVAGVGNYVKAEALYLAKLSPKRTGNSLTDDEIFRLNKAIHSVLRESYKSGGSTFRTYADFNGNVGTFTDRFMVYNQKVDPLGNKVVREETKDKRTTHWVPAIQK